MAQEIGMLRRLRYGLESLLVKVCYFILSRLPYPTASAAGGYLAAKFGPLLNRSTVAKTNLHLAMPELTPQRIQVIVQEMWNNLGRTFAEFPHISRMSPEEMSNYIELEGTEHVIQAASHPNGNIYFTGHLGNWELAAKCLSDLGKPVSSIYRKGNNPGLGSLIEDMRSHYVSSAIPKGQSGSREILEILKDGGRIGMLVDQKMNDGIPASFFGRPAMTAPAIARLALKYRCPVLPIRVVRVSGAHFKIRVSPPIEINDTGNPEQDTIRIMDNINQILETWIREYPGQWIWLHNRWS
jgi:KDO2-lipid IV(A) lauroyltransferase